MPFHDLNVAYTTDHADLSHTLSFHHELGYNVVSVAIAVTGKLPPTPQIIPLAAITTPPTLHVLTRLTLTISDTTQNHRLASLHPNYDLLALHPTTEKTLQLCCSSLECDLISLDFSQRLPFILKFKTVASALQRGVRFEICYSPGITGGNDARRNLISGAASLIRATRGRGIIISSNARTALGVRAPWDIINLAQVWGLGQERGKEALCEEAGRVVKLASIKRSSYRGVVDIIDSGASPSKIIENTNRTTAPSVPSLNTNTTKAATPFTKSQAPPTNGGTKRKGLSSAPDSTQGSVDDKKLSKREVKRRAAKKARFENADPGENLNKNGFPIEHESLAVEEQ